MQDIHPLSLRSSAVRWVPEAHISTNIVELIHPGIEISIAKNHKVKVLVVGHDLPNLTNRNYKGWRDLLEKWIKLGVKIEYVALDDRESVLDNLSANRELLAHLASEGRGGINIFVPKISDQIEENRARVLDALRQEYRTFHFVLVVDESDEVYSQMWLEGDHQPKATVAYDCYYFPAEHAFESPEFYQHRSNFEFLKNLSELAM